MGDDFDYGALLDGAILREAWYREGAEHALDGRLDAALERFEQARAEHRWDAGLARLAWLGRAARFEEALAESGRLVDAFPEVATGWFVQGRVLISLGRIDDAIVSLEMALLAKPGHAEALLSLAEAHRCAGRFDDAYQLVCAVVDASPYEPDRMHLRAQYEALRGDAGAALRWLRDAVERTDDWEEPKRRAFVASAVASEAWGQLRETPSFRAILGLDRGSGDLAEVLAAIERWAVARGASPEQLAGGTAARGSVEAVATALGHDLPRDYEAFLRRYACLPVVSRRSGLFQLVTPAEALDRRASLLGIAWPTDEPPAASPKLRPGWWHTGWLPIGSSPNADDLCLDLDPAPAGTRGQIFVRTREEGPCEPRFASFTDLLRWSRDVLHGGWLDDIDLYGR